MDTNLQNPASTPASTEEAKTEEGKAINPDGGTSAPTTEEVFAEINGEKFKSKEELLSKASKAMGTVANLIGEKKRLEMEIANLKSRMEQTPEVQPSQKEFEVSQDEIEYIKQAAKKGGIVTEEDLERHLESLEIKRQQRNLQYKLELAQSQIPELAQSEVIAEISSLSGVKAYRERMAKAENPWIEGYEVWKEINGIVEPKKNLDPTPAPAPSSTGNAPEPPKRELRSSEAWFLQRIKE
jgi:hypothetical protein